MDRNDSYGFNYSSQLGIPLLPLPSVIPTSFNGKNKFINKIRKLVPESTTLTFRRQPADCTDGPQGKSDRKQRNKLAARQSRHRKKEYIHLMEKQICELQSQLQDANRALESARSQLFGWQMHQHTKKGQTSDKHQHIIRKISQLVNDPKAEERNNQLNICLDSIVYRIGATGNERRTVLSKLYTDVINFSMPAIDRYFIWAAEKKVHLFKLLKQDVHEDESEDVHVKQQMEVEMDGHNHRDNHGQMQGVNNGVNQINGYPSFPQDDVSQGWFKQMASKIDLVDLFENKRQKIEQIATIFTQQKHVLLQSSLQLLAAKAQMEKYGPFFDKIVNDIRQIFEPAQVAQLILFIQKHQYRKQVRLFDQQQQEILQIKERSSRKRVKTQ